MQQVETVLERQDTGTDDKPEITHIVCLDCYPPDNRDVIIAVCGIDVTNEPDVTGDEDTFDCVVCVEMWKIHGPTCTG